MGLGRRSSAARKVLKRLPQPAAPALVHLESTTFTARDRDVLRRLAEGATNRDIAADLGLTEGTVKNYISSLLTKTSLNDRTQLALFAARHASLHGDRSARFILFVINQADVVLSGQLSAVVVAKIGLTYLVPYSVSTYSALAANRLASTCRRHTSPCPRLSYWVSSMQNPDEEEQPLDRCGWAAGDALLAEYHDREWGVPLRDDHALVAAAAAQEITGLATIEILPV